MTATTQEVVIKKFWTRGRVFGAVYLLLGLITLFFTFTRIESGAISKFGLGIIGKPPAIKIPIPAQPTLIVLGLILTATGIYSIWKRLGDRVENTLLGINFFVLLLAILTGLTVGTSMDVVGLLKDSIRLATPIALGALAGLMCERSGIVNVGIEGMMLTAACMGYAASLYSQNMWFALFIAILSGMLIAALHAVLSIRFMVDQVISGMVINILAVGVTGYVRKAFLLGKTFSAAPLFPYVFQNTPLWDIPIIGPILFQHQPMVYAMFILIALLYFMLFYTPWGLRTRAVGEHPRAADTLGVNVFLTRYVNVILAGAIAGLGGAWFSLETVGNFDDMMTNGKGFIALAALIFGNWNPIGASLGAWLFGFADALAFKLQILDIQIPYQFINMTPYVLTMIALAGVIGKTYPPAAVGVPYEKQ